MANDQNNALTFTSIIFIFILFGLSLISTLTLLCMKLYKKIWGKKIDYVRDSGEIVRNALSKDAKSITIEPETDTMKIIEEMAEHLKEMGNTITSIMGNVKAIKPVLN